MTPFSGVSIVDFEQVNAGRDTIAPDAYSEPKGTYKMELFAKIGNESR